MTRLHHYDNLNTARFVTVLCYRRKQLLTEPRRIPILLEETDIARNKRLFLLFGYVTMPEHIYLVLHPQDGAKLGPIIGEIKSRTARRVFSNMRETGIPILDSLMINKDGVQDRPFGREDAMTSIVELVRQQLRRYTIVTAFLSNANLQRRRKLGNGQALVGIKDLVRRH